MISPELDSYVTNARKQGLTNDQIKQELIKNGWSVSDVDAAMAISSSPSPMPQPPLEPDPFTPETSQTPKNYKKIFVGTIVALLILGGSTLAYTQQLWPFTLVGPSQQNLVADLPAKLETINFFGYSMTFALASQPRETNTQPLTKELLNLDDSLGNFTDFLDALQSLPSSLDVKFTIAGDSQTNTEALGTQFHADLALAMGDFNFAMDADFLTKNETYFLKVNKFPGLFFDIEAIKGKWIKITSEELKDSGYDFITESTEFGTEQGMRTGSVTEQLRKLYTLALQENFLALTPSTTKRADVPRGIQRFSVSSDQSKLSSFYQHATDNLKSYGEDAILKFDQKTFDTLQSQKFATLYSYLQNNTTFEVWIDGKTGYPAKLFHTFRIVPDPAYAPNLQDKQFIFSLTSDLSKINQPVTFTEPVEALTFEEARFILTGETRELSLIRKQISNIYRIRSALELYYDLVGSYPETLSELVTHERKLLSSLPTDSFTKTVFPYSSTKKDYLLTYTIQLPKIQGESKFSSEIEDYRERFVDGINHATSKFISQETKSTF